METPIRIWYVRAKSRLQVLLYLRGLEVACLEREDQREKYALEIDYAVTEIKKWLQEVMETGTEEEVKNLDSQGAIWPEKKKVIWNSDKQIINSGNLNLPGTSIVNLAPDIEAQNYIAITYGKRI